MTLNNEIVKDMCFCLFIKTDQEPVSVTGLLNRFENEHARVIDVKTKLEWYKEDDIIESDDLNLQKVFKGDDITLICNRSSYEKTFKVENGGLTALELTNIICDFEKNSRNYTEWFGGVDTHHIFFEGMFQVEPGKYSIFWGS